MGLVEYAPFGERPVSWEYRRLLTDVASSGRPVPSRQGPRAFTLLQQTMRFELADGFPVITERDVSSFWRKAIGELCAFINGATTLAELAAFGCDWWGPWATPGKTAKRGLAPGDLGPGSYGGAFRRFPSPKADGPEYRVGDFDQFAHLVEQIREFPELRTHFITPWIPEWNARGGGRRPKTTISPCHGWVHVRVFDGGLHLHLFQRSGDVPVGVPANMIQYAALALMLGHLTGYRPETFYHTISDAHVYEDQFPAVNAILKRVTLGGPRRLPTVTLNAAGRRVRDIHEFRAEHFELADYEPYPASPGIPVAV